MKIKAIDIFGAAALTALVGVAIAGAVKRKREQEGKIKQIIQGVGDVSVWNKGHIRNWFAHEHYEYPEKIVVNISNRPYYINDGCWEVYSYSDRDAKLWASDRVFSIREKDLDYLRELCERYNIEYIEL